MDSEWQRTAGTLSDKTARKEFALTQEEIAAAIRAGKLHYRCNWSYGNPYLRLLRREVEALVTKKHGGRYLREQQLKTQLALVNRDLRRLKTQIVALEERKAKLMADPTGTAGTGQARVRAAARRQGRRTRRSNPSSARPARSDWRLDGSDLMQAGLAWLEKRAVVSCASRDLFAVARIVAPQCGGRVISDDRE